jgi:serine protease AprX
VLDAQGAGRTSDVINAIQFVVANRAKLNVQIINLSLGHPIFARPEDDPLVQAVEKASQAGLFVVVSAGNYGLKADGTIGYAGITSPGNAHSAITIGATDTLNTIKRDDDSVAAYSSRGPTWYEALPKPDLVSPGTRLASDAAIGSTLYNAALAAGRIRKGDQLLVLNGTSMGTAVTTGVVALVLQAHNQNGFHRQRPITPNLMKALLEYSAIAIADTDALTQGTGEINAAGAITLARAIDTSRPLGSWWLATGVSETSTIGRTSYAWAANILWGENVLWGESV